MTDEQITSKEERRMFFEMFKKQCFVDLNKRVENIFRYYAKQKGLGKI